MSLGLLAIYAFLPVEQKIVTFEWDQSGSHGQPVVLLLTERTPDKLWVDLPCPDPGQYQVFETSARGGQAQALTLRVEDEVAVIELPVAHGLPTPYLRLPTERRGATCDPIEMFFQRESGSLTLKQGEHLVETNGLADDVFQVTGLSWDAPEASTVRVELQTMPSAEVRNSTWQKWLLSTIAVLAVLAVCVIARQREDVDGMWLVRLRQLLGKVDLWDGSMAALMLVTALIDLPRVDDGGILTRARLGADSIFTSHLSTMHEGLALPQRGLYESLLGLTVGWSDVVLILRGPTLLAGIGAWLVFRHAVLPRLISTPRARLVILPLWAAMALSFVAWFPTLRPEPMIALLAILALAVVLHWPASTRAWPYILLLFLSGLAISLHVAGLIVLAMSVGALRRIQIDVRDSPSKTIAGLSWGLVVAALPVLIGANVQFLYRHSVGFRSGSAGKGPMETSTYLSVLSGSPSMITFVGLTLLSYAFIMFSLFESMATPTAFDWRTRSVLAGLSLSPLALVATPSKLGWHVAVYVPITLVGVALMVRQTRIQRALELPFVLIAVVYATVLIFGAMTVGHLGAMLGPYAYRTIDEGFWPTTLPNLVGGDALLGWWLGIVVVLVVGAWLAARTGSAPRLATVAVSLVTLVAGVPIATQLLSPTIDALAVEANDWTFTRQSVGGLTSSDQACGLMNPAQTFELLGASGPAQTDGVGTPIVTGSRVAAMLMPCANQVEQSDGYWRTPDIVLGGLANDQLRFLEEFDLDQIGCDSGSSGDLAELCFYRLDPFPKTLTPVSVAWAVE